MIEIKHNSLQEQTNNDIILPGDSSNIQQAKYDPRYFKQQGDTLKPLYAGCYNSIMSSNIIQFTPFFAQYQPIVGDLIIGVVKFKSADSYLLTINPFQQGSLGALDFDGATKRNRPNINVGSLVYCRVSSYKRGCNAQLTCIQGAKNKLGQLKNGVTLQFNPYKIKIIKSKLAQIGKSTQYQAAIGKNGIFWLNHKSLKSLMLLRNIFTLIAEQQSPDKIQILVSMLHNQ